MTPVSTDDFELRLFLEEICCNLCRFLHVEQDGVRPETVRIDQEAYLGSHGSFADIRVEPQGQSAYVVEVKYGYTAERIVRSLARKYGPAANLGWELRRLVLVADTHRHANWPVIERLIRDAVRPGIELEVWDEAKLLGLIRHQFGVSLDSITATDLLDVRDAMDKAKGRYAFGDAFDASPLDMSLLWHLGYWRLRQLREQQNGEMSKSVKRSLLPPGLYSEVVVMMADLTGFSSYVRDTRDERVVRNCLTAFYSKARHQIINSGGFLYQFLGDAVIGFWGAPDKPADYAGSAVQCAIALSDLGNSVSIEWQRQIDRMQTAGGVHIGMAIGDLSVMSLRPFGRAHLGAVGDSINMAARLMSAAGSGDIVVSNMLYQRLRQEHQTRFAEIPPVEAKNVGKIKGWKLSLGDNWAMPG